MNFDQELTETYFFDYSNPKIQEIVKKATKINLPQKENAINLYNFIRDSFYYNPYLITFNPQLCKASSIAQRKYGHCLDKATLLISCCRAIGIPAKLHLVKVKNHIAVEKLIETYGTDELSPHAFAELYLNNKWIKATPAFNKDLCKKLNVDVLEFNGENDSLFQQYDKKGNKFMEYLDDYGSFNDLPHDFVVNNLLEHYPGIEKYKHNKDLVDITI